MGVRVGEDSARVAPCPGSDRCPARGCWARRPPVRSRCGSWLVAIQGHATYLDEWVVAVRPHLGQIERVEPVVLGLLERHDLHVQRTARELTGLDVLVQIALVVVGIRRRHLSASSWVKHSMPWSRIGRECVTVLEHCYALTTPRRGTRYGGPARRSLVRRAPRPPPTGRRKSARLPGAATRPPRPMTRDAGAPSPGCGEYPR